MTINLRKRLLLCFLGVACIANVTAGIGLIYVNAAVERFELAVHERAAQLVALGKVNASLLELHTALDNPTDQPNMSERANEAETGVQKWLREYGDTADREEEKLHALTMLQLASDIHSLWQQLRTDPKTDPDLHTRIQKLRTELLEMIHFAVEEETEELNEDLELMASYRQSALVTGVIATLTAVFIAVYLGGLLSQSVVRPVTVLRDAAERFGREQYDMPVTVKGPPELTVLAEAFNRMSKRILSDQEALENQVTALDQTNSQLQSQIEQRQQALNALERSEQKFRKVAETANDAIICLDEDGQVVFWNDTATRLFGHSAAHMTNQPIATVLPLAIDDLIQQSIDQHNTANTRPGTFKLVGTHQDGQTIRLELSLADWRTELGRFFTVIARQTPDDR